MGKHWGNVSPGATVSDTATFAAADLPSAPGTYSFKVYTFYPTNDVSISYFTMNNAPQQATFTITTPYYLTMNASAGGSVIPASDWYNSGTVVAIFASTNAGYVFNNWIGTGIGSYSGTNNLAYITVNGPITETADFILPPQLKSYTSGTNLVISWPTNAVGFTLKATNLLVKASNWPIYTANPPVVGTNYQVVMPLTGGKQFFRLEK